MDKELLKDLDKLIKRIKEVNNENNLSKQRKAWYKEAVSYY